MRGASRSDDIFSREFREVDLAPLPDGVRLHEISRDGAIFRISCHELPEEARGHPIHLKNVFAVAERCGASVRLDEPLGVIEFSVIFEKDSRDTKLTQLVRGIKDALEHIKILHQELSQSESLDSDDGEKLWSTSWMNTNEIMHLLGVINPNFEITSKRACLEIHSNGLTFRAATDLQKGSLQEASAVAWAEKCEMGASLLPRDQPNATPPNYWELTLHYYTPLQQRTALEALKIFLSQNTHSNPEPT